MPKTKLTAEICRAGLVSKQDDLRLRAQARPTGYRVALDDPVMSTERFRGGKNRQHWFALFTFLVNVGMSFAETPSTLAAPSRSIPISGRISAADSSRIAAPFPRPIP